MTLRFTIREVDKKANVAYTKTENMQNLV